MTEIHSFLKIGAQLEVIPAARIARIVKIDAETDRENNKMNTIPFLAKFNIQLQLIVHFFSVRIARIVRIA